MLHHLLLLCAALLPTISAYPGYAVHITGKGLDFGAEAGGGAIQQLLLSTPFPSYTLNEAGVAYLKLSNIAFKSFDKAQWFYALTPPSAVTYGMTGAAMEIDGDFVAAIVLKFLPRNISIDGKLQATAGSVGLSLTIGLGMDNDGRPTVHADNCNVNVAQFDVQLTGSVWAYILDIFHKQIAQDIQGQINKALCSAATTLINDKLSKTIQKVVPSPVPIGNTSFAFDYHLLSILANNTEPKRIDIAGVGGVSYHNQYSGPNRNPNQLAIPGNGLNTSMGYVFVSDFVLQSAFDAATSQGLIQFTLNQETVPAAKGFLRTQCPGALCLGSIITQLATVYPNSTCQIDLQAKPGEGPFAVFDTNGTHVGINEIQVGFGIYNPAGKPEKFALAAANVSVEVSPEVSPEKIYGTASVKEFTIEQIYSTLPEKINWNFFEQYLKYLAGSQLNKFLKKGYTFPNLDGVSFVNPRVRVLEHTLEVSTDIDYTPK